jgi:hypothetical protein
MPTKVGIHAVLHVDIERPMDPDFRQDDSLSDTDLR